MKRLLMPLLALSLMTTGSSSFAAPTPKEAAEAKTLWAKGRNLSAQKRFDDAVTALRGAHDKDPKVQYKLDLARALIEISALLEADERLGEIATSSERNVDKAKSVAAKLQQDLDKKIPTLSVKVAGPGAESATVTIDGQRVPVGKANKLDPGTRVVVARGEAGQEARERVDLAESQRESVLVTLSAPAVVKKADDEAGGGGSGNMLPAAISYAVGGAGLAVGAVLGILAFEKTASIEEVCGGTNCPPQYAADIAIAQDYGTGSTIAFAVGGLSVAAAVILTFTVGMDDEQPEDAKTSRVRVTPLIGPGFVGAVGSF